MRVKPFLLTFNVFKCWFFSNSILRKKRQEKTSGKNVRKNNKCQEKTNSNATSKPQTNRNHSNYWAAPHSIHHNPLPMGNDKMAFSSIHRVVKCLQFPMLSGRIAMVFCEAFNTSKLLYSPMLAGNCVSLFLLRLSTRNSVHTVEYSSEKCSKELFCKLKVINLGDSVAKESGKAVIWLWFADNNSRCGKFNEGNGPVKLLEFKLISLISRSSRRLAPMDWISNSRFPLKSNAVSVLANVDKPRGNSSKVSRAKDNNRLSPPSWSLLASPESLRSLMRIPPSRTRCAASSLCFRVSAICLQMMLPNL